MSAAGLSIFNAPPSQRTKSAFFSHIEAAFKQDTNGDTEALVSEALKLLARKISGGEIKDVMAALTPDMRALWPSAIE